MLDRTRSSDAARTDRGTTRRVHHAPRVVADDTPVKPIVRLPKGDLARAVLELFRLVRTGPQAIVAPSQAVNDATQGADEDVAGGKRKDG